MWIFLNNAFISVVGHDSDESLLLVRARLRGDIERAFERGDAPIVPDVVETPHADYRFRATVSVEEFAWIVSNMPEEIDYPNFKDSIPKSDRARHSAYMSVWDVMSREQEREHRLEEARPKSILDVKPRKKSPLRNGPIEWPF